MNDNFNSILWELGKDSPELQEAIAHSMKTPPELRGYSIPTRTYCEATGEVEDIHITAFTDIEDPAKRDIATRNIKRVDSMTVGELARTLNYCRAHLIAKEVKGQELTEPEKTIRDIDITALAVIAVLACPKLIKGKAFNSPEEFKAEWEKATKGNTAGGSTP